jgi:hypothetical protein
MARSAADDRERMNWGLFGVFGLVAEFWVVVGIALAHLPS